MPSSPATTEPLGNGPYRASPLLRIPTIQHDGEERGYQRGMRRLFKQEECAQHDWVLRVTAQRGEG